MCLSFSLPSYEPSQGWGYFQKWLTSFRKANYEPWKVASSRGGKNSKVTRLTRRYRRIVACYMSVNEFAKWLNCVTWSYTGTRGYLFRNFSRLMGLFETWVRTGFEPIRSSLEPIRRLLDPSLEASLELNFRKSENTGTMNTRCSSTKIRTSPFIFNDIAFR